MHRSLILPVAMVLTTLGVGCTDGTGGTGATPAASTGTPLQGSRSTPGSGALLAGRTDNWPTYHRNAARTGYDPPFSPGSGPAHRAWATRLDGAVYAEPLVVGGRILVATEHDSVYALGRGGRILWRRHLGRPVPLAALPCGDIDPLGVTSTPAYSRHTGLLYVSAELNRPLRHRLFALDPVNGRIRWSRGIDPPRMRRRYQQQRGALALDRGRVEVTFGGLDGDCGPYHGWVVSVRADGRGGLGIYRTPSRREAGIWAPSGPAVDPATGRTYVAVGNGAATARPYDDSDSVVALVHSRKVSLFAPRQWASENAADRDLGSTGPALVQAGRHRWVFADGKGGRGYLLHRRRLGGIGGQAATLRGCTSFGGTAYHARTIFVPCSEGLTAVRIRPGPHLHVRWRNSAATFGAAPVVGGGAVWAVSDGRLLRINRRIGRTVRAFRIGPAPHFATPTLHGHLVLVGTMRGVRAISTS